MKKLLATIIIITIILVTHIGIYNDEGVISIGVSIQLFNQQVGGAIGIDNGQVFGSVNVNHKIITGNGGLYIDEGCCL